MNNQILGDLIFILFVCFGLLFFVVFLLFFIVFFSRFFFGGGGGMGEVRLDTITLLNVQ